MKNRLFAFLAILFIAGVAFAGSTGNKLIPTIEGKGIPFETNMGIAAGAGRVAVPIFWVSDDTAVDDITGVALDTGDEACAVFAMDCVEVYTFAVGGGSGDEVVDSACNTDLANTTIALAFCN